MDLIHADAARAEMCYIDRFVKYDACISANAEIEDNSFALTLSDADWEADPIQIGDYIYIPGTEWGGRVEYLKHSTKSAEITASGPVWRGMLCRKVISPPTGEAYFVVTDMEGNTVLQTVLNTSFLDFFVISEANTGVTLSAQWRYAVMLAGLQNAFSAAGLALNFSYSQRLKRPVISARIVNDYSQSIDISQDYGVYITTKEGGIEAYNHIIALGKGELTERTVLELFRLDDGTITDIDPGNRGANDLAETLDYPNAETVEELRKSAVSRLKESVPDNSVELDVSDLDLAVSLGDIVGARDRLTGLVATATVTDMILTITPEGGEKIDVKVG